MAVGPPGRRFKGATVSFTGLSLLAGSALQEHGTSHGILHNFHTTRKSPSPDVRRSLIESSDGHLFGTNSYDEVGGTVFRMNLDGTGYAILHGRGCAQYRPVSEHLWRDVWGLSTGIKLQ
jgi:hypothetical protein